MPVSYLPTLLGTKNVPAEGWRYHPILPLTFGMELSYMEQLAKLTSKVNELIGNDGAHNENFGLLMGALQNWENYINKLFVNACDYGMSSESEDNTVALQNAVNDAVARSQGVYIPSGTYVVCKPVYVPDGATLEVIGETDAFANSMNRELVGKENHAKANGTTLVYRGAGAMFRHQGCVFKFGNLSMVSQDEDKNYLYKATVVGQKVVQSSTKGKIYAENCLFAGWKTVAGDPYVSDELELALGGALTKPDTPEQCCIVATRCRFSFCGCAVNMMVDGRLDDCAINKCWYGANFYGNAGFTTLANTRIEWCVFEGVRCEGSHEVLITGCEFDRCGYASVSMSGAVNCGIIGNTMRRSGADETLAIEDSVHNTHLYLFECVGGVVSGNITVKKNTSDAGTGKTRPTNAYYIAGCEDLSICENYMLGRNSGTYNVFDNNAGCSMSGNVGMENDGLSMYSYLYNSWDVTYEQAEFPDQKPITSTNDTTVDSAGGTHDFALCVEYSKTLDVATDGTLTMPNPCKVKLFFRNNNGVAVLERAENHTDHGVSVGLTGVEVLNVLNSVFISFPTGNYGRMKKMSNPASVELGTLVLFDDSSKPYIPCKSDYHSATIVSFSEVYYTTSAKDTIVFEAGDKQAHCRLTNKTLAEILLSTN